jgi:uncharacterized protein (TIGR02271 family)
MQTVLGTFDDKQTAQTAVEQLLAHGFTRASVHLQSVATTAPTTEGASRGSGNSIMSAVGSFFSNLFESDEKETAGTYAEAIRRGSTVVAVDADSDEEVEEAQSVMGELGSVNVAERAEQWKSQGWSGFDPNEEPLSGGELAARPVSVPVVQEEMAVGKRKVNLGGLRVIKRMSEVPVSEVISLRQENATVQRTPVNREATEADFQNFKEGSFEVRETAEEAIIGKSARVVEEVSVGRKVTNRAEKISDTVRRTDVEVERIPGTDSEINRDTTKPA